MDEIYPLDKKCIIDLHNNEKVLTNAGIDDLLLSLVVDFQVEFLANFHHISIYVKRDETTILLRGHPKSKLKDIEPYIERLEKYFGIIHMNDKTPAGLGDGKYRLSIGLTQLN